MIIIGNDPQAIADLQHYLGEHFEMKDLGSLNYFLGLKVLALTVIYCPEQNMPLTCWLVHASLALPQTQHHLIPMLTYLRSMVFL